MTQTSKRTQHDAHYWATKAQLGSLTLEEERELQDWLERDPRHKGAYVRAQAIRTRVDSIAALAAGVTPAAAKPRRRLARFAFWLGLSGEHRAGLYAALASIALATIGALYFTTGLFGGDSYVSNVGEFRQVALNDGSNMLLNTATKVTVDLRAASREVKLTRGEALFEVAKDSNRPFRVHAGDITVRAVGTAFSVRNEGTRVDIVVSEGTIELSRDGGPPPTQLTANHRATIENGALTRVEAIDPRETDRQLAWRRGRVEFDGQALVEAIAEINRHNRRKVVVTDPQLARHPIVGSFRAIDSEAFATIAAAMLGARVVADENTLRIEAE